MHLSKEQRTQLITICLMWNIDDIVITTIKQQSDSFVIANAIETHTSTNTIKAIVRQMLSVCNNKLTVPMSSPFKPAYHPTDGGSSQQPERGYVSIYDTITPTGVFYVPIDHIVKRIISSHPLHVRFVQSKGTNYEIHCGNGTIIAFDEFNQLFDCILVYGWS